MCSWDMKAARLRFLSGLSRGVPPHPMTANAGPSMAA